MKDIHAVLDNTSKFHFGLLNRARCSARKIGEALSQRPCVKLLLTLVLALTGMAAMGLPLHGQVTFGSVVGFVADASQSAIVGATVTLVNTGTNERRTLQTDGAGNYSFANVPAGVY